MPRAADARAADAAPSPSPVSVTGGRKEKGRFALRPLVFFLFI